LAGKKVQYRITIKEVKEKKLPELNNDFAIDIGADSLDSLRNKVRDDLVTKAKANAEKKAREAVIDSIAERHSFDVPGCLIQDELEDYARHIAANLARQGIDINRTSLDWKKVFDQQRPKAEQEVRRSLILDAIANQEGIEVTDADLEAEFQKLAEETGKAAAAIRAQLDKDKRIQGFREHLRQNKALDFIYRNANISGG
jgi:trigger factor